MRFPYTLSGMANIVDPDQTAPLEQSDLGLHCLHGPSCQKIRCTDIYHTDKQLTNLISKGTSADCKLSCIGPIKAVHTVGSYKTCL